MRIYFGVSSTRKRICKIQYRWDLARRNFSKVKKKLEGLCNIPNDDDDDDGKGIYPNKGMSPPQRELRCLTPTKGRACSSV